ncbi:hypothetical protein AWM79_13645 [Pseudomonas agarici]|uniref:Uncharacterized protein n=1 Tax=Pseudomonas agarici TaxID=46677 RepID=A0A0X1T2L6_PSEAA|nr:DUF6386 family protein [Pseudomonas agarici]AMB86290.1 hypothetical protein AWM79_13645 [Pseudomonas agarici]NWB90328.1 hypothetical protein [Pseudomonas agarici]NWC08773.1 hypothetical protein [Pseudomonas agarici]SEK57301.1 hypothetical protein SAMN05216604_104101 [Pseudomonas agarici]
MIAGFSVVTDTATIAVFDLQAIKHRISDTSDWWSIVEDEIYEVNEGNIAFFGLGEDGKFNIRISDSLNGEDGLLNIYFPSGQVFIGAGEDTTGGDLQPDGSDAIQGAMLDFEPGTYQVKYKKTNDAVEFSFERSDTRKNSLTEAIKL